ncbi:MAG TPA: hypothetical protein VMR17_25135 [Xanthobacteraceae bacterium]|nr:hypothetical protein [Xanthobacteraceae bacterium]
MAPGAEAEGFLTLSLVSWGIAPVQVTSPRQRFRFSIIETGSGNQVHRRYIDAATMQKFPGASAGGWAYMMAYDGRKAVERAN